MDPLDGHMLCRFCLCSTAALISIFEENSAGFSVKEAIEDLLRLYVNEEHGLFWLICPTCLGKLSFLRLFRLQCIESNLTYQSRFSFMENAEEYDGFSCNRSDKVEEVNQTPNQKASGERFSVTAASNEVANLKADPETDVSVPEFGIVVGWPGGAKNDHSCNHEGNIDAEEMDVSQIKVEPHEVGHKVWSEENSLVNHSEGGNENHEESDMSNKDGGGSVRSNEESPVEGLPLNGNEERLCDFTGTGKRESDGMEHPQETAVGSLSGHVFGNSGDFMGTRSGKSIPGSVSVNGNERSPAMDSSLSDCFSENQNQGYVHEVGASSDGSSENHLGKGTGKFPTTKESIGSTSSILLTVEPSLKPFIDSILKTREANKKLSCGNPSGEDGKGKSFFTCEICGKWFHHKGRLISHRKYHNSGNSIKCDVCGLQFSEKRLLSEHACRVKIESSNEGDMYGPGNLATSHLPTGVSGKPFECAICGQSFLRCDTLEDHVLLHKRSKVFACIHCNRQFTSKKRLLAHLDGVHGESNVKKCCEVCGKKCPVKYFDKHFRTHTEAMLKCCKCGKEFRERSDVLCHMKQHTEFAPHKCYSCPRTFTHPYRLKKHMRCHSGGKPFSCPTCGGCYPDSGSLRRHWSKPQVLKNAKCAIVDFMSRTH